MFLVSLEMYTTRYTTYFSNLALQNFVKVGNILVCNEKILPDFVTFLVFRLFDKLIVCFKKFNYYFLSVIVTRSFRLLYHLESWSPDHFIIKLLTVFHLVSTRRRI